MSSSANKIVMFTPAAEAGHARYTRELMTALHREPDSGFEFELVSAENLEQEFRAVPYKVHAILPGMTETERVEQLFRQRAEAGATTVDAVRAALIAKDGLARLGKPEDVAALALFLCSARACHIQGTAIAVDGGATPGLY